jgi:hypothetical protein
MIVDASSLSATVGPAFERRLIIDESCCSSLTVAHPHVLVSEKSISLKRLIDRKPPVNHVASKHRDSRLSNYGVLGASYVNADYVRRRAR